MGKAGKMTERLSVCAACMALAVSVASAQTQKLFDPLTSLSPTILCHQVPRLTSLPVPDASIFFHFENGVDRFGDRMLEAGYDSSGTPFVLRVLAVEQQANRKNKTYSFIFRFDRAGERLGQELRLDEELNQNPPETQKNSDEGTPPAVQPVSKSSADQAYALAVSLWGRRCGRPTAPFTGVSK